MSSGNDKIHPNLKQYIIEQMAEMENNIESLKSRNSKIETILNEYISKIAKQQEKIDHMAEDIENIKKIASSRGPLQSGNDTT